MKITKSYVIAALLASILLGVLVLGAILLWPKVRPASSGVPTVILAASAMRTPRLNYEGPGIMNYRTNLYELNFTVNAAGGSSSGMGEFVWGQDDECKIIMALNCDRDIRIRLLGFSKESGPSNAKMFVEDIPFKKGQHRLDIKRFCRQSCEFR